MISAAIIKKLAVLAELHDKVMSDDAKMTLAKVLSMYPEGSVLSALDRCLLECRRFPSIAEIVERIPDGHPGVEEAWAMLPKDEADTVIWTDEMSDAYGLVRKMMDDQVAARMAFREAYTRLLGQARASGKRAIFWPSIGSDPGKRDAALKIAAEKGRIQLEYDAVQLEGPDGPHDGMNLDEIKTVLGAVLKNMPDAERMVAQAKHTEVKELTSDEVEKRKQALREQAASLTDDADY